MTSERENQVAEHYTIAGLGERLRAALGRAGKDVSALTQEDLAPFDAFHVRGREATAELARDAGVERGARVLDIGSGIGGTARFLATSYGCDVTGVDLTEEFCRTATELSALVGLSQQTRFLQGSALELPVADGTFDLAWTEHVQMNIPDKQRFYAEATRALRKGGKLVFHDIFQGPAGAPYFPAPWADRAELSALCPPQEVRTILERLGLEVLHWVDSSERSRAWFEAVLERNRSEGPPALGVHLVVKGSPPEKLGNVHRGLNEKRLVTVQAIARKP